MRILSFFAAMAIAIATMAQNPVSWTAKAHMTSATEGVITLTAAIEDGWHVYSTQPSDDGPIPTKVYFGGQGIKYQAATYASPKSIKTDDPVFDCQVAYWEKKVTFTRKFTVTDPAKAKVNVKVTYMSCNEETCRPPVTEEFSPAITPAK